jgi:hypothetical protein
MAEREDGLMSEDPMMLSETVEEEESPKMGVGEYAENVKDFLVDLTPSGTADAIIDTGKALLEGEYGKAAMSAIGAIPGGKTAGKAAKALDVGVDESKLAGDQLRKYASATVELLEEAAKKTGKVAGDKGEKLYAPVEEGTKVAVRKNLNSSVGEGIDPSLNTLQTLHAGSFSGKALSYMPVVTIKDAEFAIGQAGRRDIASKMLGKETKAAKNKFPMAAVTGKYTDSKSVLEQYNPEELVEIGFNPKFNHLFIDMGTGQAVKGADEATIIGDRVYAKGVKYWKKSEAPEPLPTSAGEEIPSDVRYREMNTGGLMMDEYNTLHMRQGGGVETTASNEMEEMNPMKDLDDADTNNDGIIAGDELVKQQVIKQQNIVDAPPQMGQMMPNMACGGLMGEMMGVTIGIESDSGNEIPAGSLPEEVADDIPAMLSEGEYVVPADVVRWHGLKHLEMMRKEAKMGLGLMAQDGRIAEVDEETKEPVNNKDAEYDIKEKDKPEVEVAEVEVVKAAEGTDVQVPDATQPFYQLRYVTDPVTGQMKMAYVDPTTGQQVSPSEFEEERASRFAPQNVLQREGLMGTEEEEVEEEECPAGYVKDPETGMCVPETIAPTPDGGEGQEDSQNTTRTTPYSEQLTTLAAERLGGLGADDLEDFEGDTLAEQALGRMTDERGVGLARAGAAFAGGPLAMIGLGVKNVYDSIGAKRAAITRSNELQDIASGLDASALPQTYNLTFDPSTASFKATTTSKITELQEREGGGTWATDYDHVGRSGKSYTSDEVFSSKEATEDVFDSIDDDFANTTETQGGGERNQFGDDEGNIGTSDLGGSGGFEGSRGVDENRGPGGQRSGGSSSQSSSRGDEPEDQDDGPGGFGLAKGGMPAVKKNKPRVAMMNYRGNK